ncbi:hypothetical protein ACH5RR_012264 [Cinchona calisaya]|uniref:At1g61320/AtMIF1 LRR domain-containing protein n=1 Tax=Cinchona calisaya TaxID=153742 RepID=A0ABD3A7T8_9GENT
MTFYDDDEEESSYFLNEQIEIAVQRGVKVLKLDLYNQGYIVPDTIFEAKSLTDLYVKGCKFVNNGRLFLLCDHIRYLCLMNIDIDDDILGRFIKGCPLIYDLVIDNCKGLIIIYVVNHNSLKKLHIRGIDCISIEVDAPFLESVHFEVEEGPHFLELHASEYLKILLLIRTYISDTFFNNFSKKFPKLEILNITHCYYSSESINCTSHSLKHISLSSSGEKKVEINAPNAIKFKYGVHKVHQIFRGVFPSQCESDVYVHCFWNSRNHLSWFLNLNQLVSNLSPSNVTLSLTCDFKTESYKYMGNISNFATYLIEVGKVRLVVQGESSTRAKSYFLDGLFWACRPKTIVLPCMYSDSRQLMELSYKKLVKDRRNQRFFSGLSFGSMI